MLVRGCRVGSVLWSWSCQPEPCLETPYPDAVEPWPESLGICREQVRPADMRPGEWTWRDRWELVLREVWSARRQPVSASLDMRSERG